MQALDGSLHHHAPPQVYTFGVLPPGASVHGKVDAFQPMRPLLHAPPAVCTVNVSADVVTGAGSGGFSAAIANRGSIPCLYMRLQLWDSKVLPAEAPQFKLSCSSEKKNPCMQLSVPRSLDTSRRAVHC